jgi:hypothetical protein
MPPHVFAPLMKEIKAAFPNRRRYNMPLINPDTYVDSEVEAVEQEFKDKIDWAKLEPEWLSLAPRGMRSAMSFLGNEAICFYLPAFLIADIKRELDGSPWSSLIYHSRFDGSEQDRSRRLSYFMERWRRLTPKQCLAVAHYLELQLTDTWINASNGQAIEIALRDYWYPRVSQ